MVVDIDLRPESAGSRLVIRISADSAGPTSRLVRFVFAVIDTVMARQQLLGIKQRVESPDQATEPETGDRGQYQLYEVIYASGDRAGVPGRVKAERRRAAAIADGVLEAAAG